MLGSGELGREVVLEAMQFAHRAHVLDMQDPAARRVRVVVDAP